MKKNCNFIFMILQAVLFLIFAIAGDFAFCEDHMPYQIVKLLPGVTYETSGSYVKMSINYDVSDSNNTLFGLGARFHFNSKQIKYIRTDNLFNLFKNSVVQEDTEDFDNDLQTDSYLLISWFEWNGRWPGVSLPCELGLINFQIIENSTPSYTPINISFSATNPGYDVEYSSSIIHIISK